MMKRLILAASAAALAAGAGATPPLPPPDEDFAVGERPMRRPPPAWDQGEPNPARVDDPLGDVWEMEEVSNWTGTWLRRGSSGVFDGYWIHPTGERVLAELQISIKGDQVLVLRHHDEDRHCRYEGQLSRDLGEVAGSYTCSWERTPMPWSARIMRMEERLPGLLR